MGTPQGLQEQVRSRHRAERTCIGCKTQAQSQELLRFVCTPEGVLLLDMAGHAPGRGAYVCCNGQCLRKALQPPRLAITLKHTVSVPDFESLSQEVLQALYARLRACVSLGQKAGALVSGYAMLRRACSQSRVLLMIFAEDIAMARREEYLSWCTQYAISYVTLFTKEELGHIIGKPSRSAVGVTAPHFVELFRTRLASLECFQAASHKV